MDAIDQKSIYERCLPYRCGELFDTHLKTIKDRTRGGCKLKVEDIQRILKQLEENTRTECIKINTRVDKQTYVTKSKFGGVPYWPDLANYPKADDGTPLTLLAQINFADLPKNDVFPRTGLLQFFILDAMDTDNYEVVYHKNIDNVVVQDDAHTMNIVRTMPTSYKRASGVYTTTSGKQICINNPFWGDYGFPVTGELALEFTKEYECANLTEYSFDDEFERIAKELHMPLPDSFHSVYFLEEFVDDISREDKDKLLDKYWTGAGHKLLGHPYFIQEDYRSSNDDDVLLFQMDSAADGGEMDRKNNIVIGDAGIISFFVNRKDLQKLDFSNVLYTWECC